MDTAKCLWSENSDGIWATACGHEWEFTAGGPEENEVLFCCFCGQALESEPYEEEEGDVSHKSTIPTHVLERGETRRQWKARKRRELDEAIRALQIYQIGCAYAPAKNTGVVLVQLYEMRAALRVDSWGR